jgi:hypothetical protein
MDCFILDATISFCEMVGFISTKNGNVLSRSTFHKKILA